MKDIHPAIDYKVIDAALGEYLELKEKVKIITERLKDINEWCKALGSFSTDVYVVAIVPCSQTRLVGMEDAIKALGKDVLEAYNLIQVIEFEKVNISKKA